MTPGAPTPSRVARDAYLRLLAERELSPRRRCAIETGVRLVVPALAVLNSWHFPGRTAGGWWWTWRWRLEVICGWNEWESLCHVRRLVPPGGTAVDVGAHIGYYTRLFSRLAGPAGRVIAIEPHPENLAVLRRNLYRRGNVTVVHAAATATDGMVQLHESPGHSNHSLLAGFTPSRSALTVPARTVDGLLAEHAGGRRIDFVKLDIEGGELSALAGMRETLGRDRPVLLVERNPEALTSAEATTADLVDEIVSHGYDVAAVLPGATLGPPDADPASTLNLLCRPRPER